MKLINEVRKEDEIYFEGPFWIKGESFKDILLGNFELVCSKVPTNFEGDNLNNHVNKSHKDVFNDFKDLGDSIDYYPRGRVGIYKGEAYINIHSKCNTPKIINSIISEYNLAKLNKIHIEHEDNHIGHHYGFKLI